MEQNEYSNTKICPVCKKEIGYHETVCIHCGNTFQVEYRDEREPYLQSNVDTYLRKFANLDRKNTIVSWNWCGFLFAANWMVYRKMYKLGILLYVGYMAAAFVAGIFVAIMRYNSYSSYMAIAIIGIVLTLVYCVLIGLFGDYWYKKKIDKLVEEGRYMADQQRKMEHVKKGGTSILSAVILIVVNAAIELLLS